MKRVQLRTLTILINIFVFNKVYASLDKAQYLFNHRSSNVRSDIDLAQELANQGLYFTAVPFLKEYLASGVGGNGEKLDNTVDDIISAVGTKQFEIFPNNVLERLNTPMIRYIRAKKSFRLGKYEDALRDLRQEIPSNHPARPFSLNLEASIHSIKKDTQRSVLLYKECVSESNNAMKSSLPSDVLRQLEVNRDYCVAGIARAQFNGGQFEEAHSSYMDLPKSSPVWPEILFEEAWNGFYLKDYNRTLGKLVTYKAPVFDYYFNPEVEVLTALTYKELCLYDDAKKTVNEFYGKYEKDALFLREFIKKHGKDFKFYYLLAKSQKEGKASTDGLLNQMLNFIVKDATYDEMYAQFGRGREELYKIKTLPAGAFRSALAQNLKETLLLQRDLIGSYVRRRLNNFVVQTTSAFEGMSYVKLEVLSKRKGELYSNVESSDRERGDIAYLSRNEKQYFWTFNGEFWADELGDYVFSLKSECN